MRDEAAKDRNQQTYARLDQAFEKAGLGRHAQFLNWGYAPVAGCADAAAGPRPDAGPNAVHERLVAELIGAAPLDHKRVLDVGCGRGGALAFMRRHHRPLALSGIDISAANIERARDALDRLQQGVSRVRLQVADACALPHADASQEVVFNLESSGAYPDLVGFFGHVRRVLVEDGIFLYGDVWPAPLIPPLRRVLDNLGFEAESVRDVTRQILAARGTAPAGVVQRLSKVDPLLCAEVETYFALPDSPMWRCMERGDACYILGRWRRTGRAPAPRRREDEQSLSGRSALLQALLQHSADDSEAYQRWFPFGAPRSDSSVNVLAFPYAVGGASVFRDWLGELPADWAFCPVQLPGREHRLGETAFRTVEAAVEALLPLVLPSAERPLALVGWSLGCKLAFEFARRWECATGQPPQLLMLGACPSPQKDLSGWPAMRDETWAARLRLLGGTPDAVLASREMLGSLGSALHGDFEMAIRYRSEATVRAPIIAIAADDDELVPVEDVEAWRSRTTGAFSLQRRTGGHFLLRKDGRALAKLLADELSSRLHGSGASVRNAATADMAFSPWLPLNGFPLPDGVRLVCFHHAGGAAQSFREWASHPALRDAVVCPVELPGRGTRYGEPSESDLATLVGSLWPGLRAILGAEHPVVLFGHSLGALIAYEIARCLEADLRAPRALIASARRAPTSISPQPWRHRLNDDALVAELRRLGGTAAEILAHRELVDLVLPAVRSDFALTETYAPRQSPKLSCPVVAIRGAGDREVSAEDLDRWSEVSGSSFEHWTFNGGHFYLTDPAVRDRLIRQIASRVTS